VIHHLPKPLRPAWLNALLDELADANDRAVKHAAMERYWQTRCVLYARQAEIRRQQLDLANRMLATVTPTTTEDR
jgi:hypothetical protein